MRAVNHNSKTGYSVDFTTVCPRQLEGHPCEYCYVASARACGSFMAKQRVAYLPYQGELQNMKQSTIDKLNKSGGLRIFSFSDYIPWMDQDIEKLLIDASKRKLQLKAITKNKMFVEKYRASGILINFSVDLVYNDLYEIRGLESIRSDSVRLRCMVRNTQDVEQVYPYVDVLTPYHGPKINDQYRPAETLAACQRLAPGKTCCQTGKCYTCQVKCGKKEN